MQRTKQFIHKFQRYIKPVFMVSVIILIVFECIQLQKSVSSAQMAEILTTIPLSRIVMMIIVGLIIVTPMIGYDYILNRMLGHKIVWRYLIPTSWSINTLNNLLGMGGLINTGLRLEFYKEEGESSTVVLQRIAQIILYMLCGLSLYALVTLIFSWLLSSPTLQYWPILLGGGLYFPVMLIIVNRQKKSFLKDFAYSDQIKLAIVSTLEWTGNIMAFLFVGYAMGLKFPILPLVAIMVVSLLVGMISFIPGGIGSFDLVMISALVKMGFQQETVIIWVLLYRLVSEIIPFGIGVICLIKEFGQRINSKYDGLPKAIVKKIVFSLLVLSLYMIGTFLILTSTIPEKVSHWKWFTWISVNTRSIYSQIPGITLGYIYLLLARITREKVKRVIPCVVVVSLVTLCYLNWPVISWQSSTAVIISLLLLYATRGQFYRKQFNYGYEMRIVDTGVTLGITAVYLLVLFKTLPHNFKFWERDFYVLAVENLWLDIFVIVAVVSLAYYIILKLMADKTLLVGEQFDRDRYKALLEKYGGNSNAGLAYLRDKRLYWYQSQGEDKLVLQYKCFSNKCVVMGSPIGDSSYFREGILDFLQTMDTLDYQGVFYEVDSDTTMLLHEFGFEFIKFGEDAQVNLQTFTLQGKKNKPLRNMHNRAQSEGLNFKIIYPPYSDDLLDELAEISDAWLGGRLEKGFSLGFFDREYLGQCPIAIAYHEEDGIVAFANVMPNEEETQVSIDLMRHHPEKTVNGTMDYLFIELFLHYKEEGKEWFDMGMAPLANVGDLSMSFIQERLAYLIYRYGTHFYSFEGLHNYKNKFSPKWSPRYTCYNNKGWLITSMLTVYLISQKVD